MAYSFKVSKVFNRMSAGLLMAALIMSSLPFAAMTAEAVVADPNTQMITICHATGSDKKPYETPNPSDGAKVVSGHDSHNGPVWFEGITVSWGDIIPPFTWYEKVGNGNDAVWVPTEYAGKNWTPEGRAIWNNGCDTSGKILINKIVVGTTTVNKSDFDFKVNGDAISSSYAPGVYTVTESPKPGIPTSFMATFSGDCNAQGQISVGVAQTKTCTITNDYTQITPAKAKLTVTKTVINTGGGTAQPNDFGLKVDSTLVLSGVQTEFSAGAYVVSETNLANYNAGLWGGDCATNGAITLGAGETKSCTITNTYVPPGPDTAKLKIVKNVVGGSAKPGDWTLAASASSPGNTYNFSDSGNPDVATFHTIAAGVVYAMSESSVQDYDFSSVVCDGGNMTSYNDIVLAKNEEVTCTFTNVYKGVTPGTIIVDKVTNPANSVQSFDFTTTGSGYSSFSLTDTSLANSQVLAPGNYSVSESVIGGWTQTNAVCISSINDTETPELLELDADETITCTFTNTQRETPKFGTLIVEKKFGEGTAASDFTAFSFILDGGATTKFNASGTNEFPLPVGTHTVVETEAPGFTISYTNCENVAVTEGVTSTCTITNTKIDNGGGDVSGCMDPLALNYDAKATKDDGSCLYNQVPVCDLSVVSDTTNTIVEKANATATVAWPHPFWTAVFPGATSTWIWGENPVADASVVTTYTFEKKFNWSGTVTSATFDVAVDDWYTVYLNGDLVGSDNSPSASYSVATADTYNVASLVDQGINTIRVVVTNQALGTDPYDNPAGLLYALNIANETGDCAPAVDTYRIKGYVWHDDNKNTEWDGLNSEDENDLVEDSLAGWTVNITNGTSSFSTTTDETGFYYFDVPAGTWTITEVVQNGWERTTVESHVVTVLATYGDYNFGNDTTDTVITTTPTRSGGGGRGTVRRPNPTVAGDMDDALPTPLVLGEQVSIVPVGAPSTGAGGTSPQWPTFTLGQLMMGAIRRSK